MLTYFYGVFLMFFKCNVQKHTIKASEQNPVTLRTNVFLIILGGKPLKTQGFPFVFGEQIGWMLKKTWNLKVGTAHQKDEWKTLGFQGLTPQNHQKHISSQSEQILLTHFYGVFLNIAIEKH